MISNRLRLAPHARSTPKLFRWAIRSPAPNALRGVVLSVEMFLGVDDHIAGVMFVQSADETYSVTLFPHVFKRASALCVPGRDVTVRGHRVGLHVAATAID